eukprot:555941_1
MLSRITGFYPALVGATIGFTTYQHHNRQPISAESIGGTFISSFLGTKKAGGWDAAPIKPKPKEKNELTEHARTEKFKFEINKSIYKGFNPNHYNYVIIGTSGTGKSTFTNTFAEMPYQRGIDIKEKTHVRDVGCVTFQESPSDPAMVIWDIPGFGTSTYEENDYIKYFGLPVFDGVILITSTRFTDRDRTLYKELRDQWLNILHDLKQNKSADHVPVYIVRTKFDVDLESRLKYKLYERQTTKIKETNFSEQIISFFFGSAKFSHDEFMEIWDETITTLENGLKEQFYDVFVKEKITDENEKKIYNDKKLMEYFFIVSGDWDNQMLSTYKDCGENKHGNEYCGWHGLWRRIQIDPFEFNGNGIGNAPIRKKKDLIRDKAWKTKHDIRDCDIYKRYTERSGDFWYSVGSLICGSISTMFSFNIGAALQHNQGVGVGGVGANNQGEAAVNLGNYGLILSGVVGCALLVLAYNTSKTTYIAINNEKNDKTEVDDDEMVTS